MLSLAMEPVKLHSLHTEAVLYGCYGQYTGSVDQSENKYYLWALVYVALTDRQRMDVSD